MHCAGLERGGSAALVGKDHVRVDPERNGAERVMFPKGDARLIHPLLVLFNLRNVLLQRITSADEIRNRGAGSLFDVDLDRGDAPEPRALSANGDALPDCFAGTTTNSARYPGDADPNA
jgi:hypothetical protein